jgi:hypothetical protein
MKGSQNNNFKQYFFRRRETSAEFKRDFFWIQRGPAKKCVFCSRDCEIAS